MDRSLQLIRDLGCQTGLALNPATPLNHLEHVLDKVNMVLLMSVNPGFGGQPFIDAVYSKIQSVRALIDNHSTPVRLQVDGGVKVDNALKIAQTGADTFVVGSAIFHSSDYAETIKRFRDQLSKVTI